MAAPVIISKVIETLPKTLEGVGKLKTIINENNIKLNAATAQEVHGYLNTVVNAIDDKGLQEAFDACNKRSQDSLMSMLNIVSSLNLESKDQAELLKNTNNNATDVQKTEIKMSTIFKTVGVVAATIITGLAMTQGHERKIQQGKPFWKR